MYTHSRFLYADNAETLRVFSMKRMNLPVDTHTPTRGFCYTRERAREQLRQASGKVLTFHTALAVVRAALPVSRPQAVRAARQNRSADKRDAGRTRDMKFRIRMETVGV